MPPRTAAEIAVGLLSRREHTREELATKLRARGFGEEEIDTTLRRLAETALQSDTRFALTYVREKRRRFGDERLRLELAQRGIGEDDIEHAMRDAPPQGDAPQQADAPPQGEEERAAELLSSKYPGKIPADKTAQALRFLQQRGFSDDIILPLLSRMTKKDAD